MAAAPHRLAVPWRAAVLIGAGRMGRAHALALRDLGVPLAAVCDVNDEACARVGAEFGVEAEQRFARAEDMLEHTEADVAVIAATADTHRELVCLAAKAGIGSILCEKPLATSLADCDTMIADCAAAGTRLAVNHQMRFMDQYLIVKQELDAGAIGPLASMTVVGGCFGLAMNGSHYIEAFSFLTGAAPVEATGWFTGDPVPNPRGLRFFDQAGEFRIVADSGQRLVLVIGRDQGHGMLATYAGAYGHIVVDELEGEAIVTQRKAEHRTLPATRYGMPWDRRAIRFPPADNVGPTCAVLSALAEGSGYPTGDDGRRAVATLAACYASADDGGRPAKIGEMGTRKFPWA